MKKCKGCGNDFIPNKFTPNHQEFCSKQCSGIFGERKIREELTDRIVKRNIYIKSKGAIKYDIMTPEMIKEQRERILNYRKHKEDLRKHPELHKSNKMCCKVYFRQCIICGSLFTTRTAIINKYCSDKCRDELNRRNIEKHWKIRSKKYDDNGNVSSRSCKECGELFIPEYGNKKRNFCSDKCSIRFGSRTGKATRRARKRGNKYESFNPFYVFERDKWTCQLCRIKTPRKLRGKTDDRAPELDHIVALSQGGEHSKRNTQCLCRRCNQEKGSMTRGQLLLFG